MYAFCSYAQRMPPSESVHFGCDRTAFADSLCVLFVLGVLGGLTSTQLFLIPCVIILMLSLWRRHRQLADFHIAIQVAEHEGGNQSDEQQHQN